MAAFFRYTPVIHHNDMIGVTNCGKAVCDDDYRFPLHQFFKRLLNQMLIFRIGKGGCLVQHYHRGILYNGTGDSNPLLLAAA